MNYISIIIVVLLAFLLTRSILRYKKLLKQVDYLNNILYRDQQPNKYVEELDKIIAKSSNSRDKDINLLQKATGLMYAGQFEEVEDIINNQISKIPVNGHHLYYQDLILSMIFNGEIEEAHKKLEDVKEILDASSKKSRSTDVVEFIYAVDDIFQEHYSEREEYFKEQCENARNCYKRAISYYCLAKISKNRNNMDEMRSYLEQAEEIGKNSFVEKIAKEEINIM